MVITREIREEISKSVSNCITSMLKDNNFIQAIAQKVTECVIKTIETRFDELEQKVHVNSTGIIDVRKDILKLKADNDYLLKNCDHLDQEGRRSNLRIFKLPEREQENTTAEVTQFLKSKLGVDIVHGNIISCTRIGKRSHNKIRSILVQFSNASMKQCVYNKKKLLKGSGVVVKEDLTERRRQLMESAIEKVTLRAVWSFMGEIFVMHNNRRVLIRCNDDLNKL
nr:unnamed protein product [Callosobruchus analis]